METTMDAAGRLVIPVEIRREAALEPGVPLEIRLRDGVIELEPKALPVSFERKGKFVVAVPRSTAPALKTADVERTRRDLRRRHRRSR